MQLNVFLSCVCVIHESTYILTYKVHNDKVVITEIQLTPGIVINYTTQAHAAITAGNILSPRPFVNKRLRIFIIRILDPP